ncbi:sigma-70 family RNA polymerase sigma factor [Anaerohalosphaeraceae bacterium U12dextr]
MMAEKDNKSVRFFSLYTTVQGRVYAFLMMLLHNRNAAEELLQETAATMWEKFDTFREGENFGAWAIAIARNKAFEYLRSNKKMKMLFSEECYQKMVEKACESSSDFHARLNALEQCIRKLELNQRQLLQLRYQDNVPVKEISQQIGGSPRLVYKRLVCIFELMRVCIQRTVAQQEL